MRIRDLFENDIEPQTYRNEILRIWKALPNYREDLGGGTTTMKNPHLPNWLAKQPDADLPAIYAAHVALADKYLKPGKGKTPAPAPAPVEDRRTGILKTLLPYFHQGLQEYIADDYTPEEIAEYQADPEWVLENLDHYLSRERSIEVRDDGLIQFWVMEADLWKAVDENDLMLALFHYTSSAKLPSIKRNGLEGGRRSVNRRTNEGVYLTTETGGPAVEGYKRNACRGNKGYPVCITVKVHFHELTDDEDDSDISSGAHQYVVPSVSPDRFVSIERA